MIQVKSTANHAGITITGDIHDFEQLYESLHKIVGEQGELIAFEGPRLRVLGICYDLRHAMMGHREMEFVDNGLDEDKMRYLSVAATDKNVYMSCNILWPEILFVMMALNDFVKIYASNQSKNNFYIFHNFRTIWDSTIAAVRQFQAAIARCMEATIPLKSMTRIFKLMNHDYTWADNYITQYIDELNVSFLEMDKEKRLKNISIMAKRLAEKGSEYQGLKQAVEEAARKYDCHPTELTTSTEYPEFIDW